jgi:hypothetical protein
VTGTTPEPSATGNPGSHGRACASSRSNPLKEEALKMEIMEIKTVYKWRFWRYAKNMLVPKGFFLSQIIPSRSSNYSSQLSDFGPIFVHESITFGL